MDGYVTIGTELDTKSFDGQIEYVKKQLEEIEYKLKQADMGFEVGNVQKLEAEYEKLSAKLGNLVEKKQEFNRTDFSGIKQSIDNVGSSVQNVTKKVSHWALAIFGVRSAYMFVRQAMSTLSQYDEQMAVNIEYIRYLLASTLKPVIETIINLAYKLLAYINAIAQAWFGVNLFANKTTKAFGKQNKALGGSVKQARELRKTLAGFDEMNILQDNGDVSSGGGGGGVDLDDVKLPNFPKLEDIPIPGWLQWILDHKDEIIAGLAGIVAGLAALKLGFSGLQALGIGVAVAGLVYTIEKIIDFLNDPSFTNFIGILEGIAVSVAGVAIAFGAWPVAIGAAVALVMVEIVKHFDEIMNLFNNLISWLDKNFLGALRTLFGPIGDILYLPFKYFVEWGIRIFETFYGGIKSIIQGVIKIFRGDFFGGIKQIFGGLLGVMTAPLQGFIAAVGRVWGQIKSSVSYWIEQFKGAFGKIKDAFLSPINDFINAVKNLWKKIKDPIEKFVKNINKTLDKINPIKIGANLGGKIANLFGFAKGGIIKLASGGVINQPGRGVPLTSAIGGERGAEGVIPLTDSQQMALLGEAIGKYITVNANIVNTMNGRIISRELQRVQNEDDFAYNR